MFHTVLLVLLSWHNLYDNAFTIREIIEKRREFDLETQIVFVGIEKTFDRVNTYVMANKE